MVMDYLFKHLIHEQYIATAHKENVATVKILMKLGFKEVAYKDYKNAEEGHTYVIHRQSYLEKYKDYKEEICIQQL